MPLLMPNLRQTTSSSEILNETLLVTETVTTLKNVHLPRFEQAKKREQQLFSLELNFATHYS